jgi:hypothetical protein
MVNGRGLSEEKAPGNPLPNAPLANSLFGNKVTPWQPKAPSVILIEDEFIV